jgi:tetratricopeptide (TPR) repeat protein
MGNEVMSAGQFLKQANKLKRAGRLDEAIALYHQAIEKQPNFHWYHHELGETFAKLERYGDAIACFQKAIDVYPNACAYYRMANNYTKLGKIEDANLVYYRAIELNPNWGIVLVRQVSIDRVIACFDYVLKRDPHQAIVYYEFSQYLAAKDFIDEAIACFRKAPQFSHHQKTSGQDSISEPTEIYDLLWQNLNQLDQFDSISGSIPKKTEAEAYFSQKDDYNFLYLNNLAKSGKNLLAPYGISLANLQIIKRDSLSLEEIYINSFNPTSRVKLSRKYIENIHNLWEPQKNHACCKAMVETGYIYSVCPFSGEILRSDTSFVIEYEDWRALTVRHIYRFTGKEVFYLVVDTFCMGKMCIYIPSKNLIIQLSHGKEVLIKIVNALKSYLVSNYHQVKEYIKNTSKKQLVLDIGFSKNFGHYYWNELSGILYLEHNDLLKKIPKFLVGNRDFFNVGGVFPEIPSCKIIKLANTEELFKTILDNNYFAVQVNDLFMTQELAYRVTRFSLKKCSEKLGFLEELERAKKHFPLLCIQIRSSRTWVSQGEGNTNIIKKLASEFPGLGVVFEGWALQEVEDPLANSMIAKEKNIVAEIVAALPPHTQVYCLIGKTNYEKTIFSHEIDVYSGPIGSGVTTVQWIANKPGVWHGHTSYYDTIWCKGQQSSTGDPLVRENIVPANWVPRNCIVDLADKNYDCDWSAIYEEIVKIIRDIAQ